MAIGINNLRRDSKSRSSIYHMAVLHESWLCVLMPCQIHLPIYVHQAKSIHYACVYDIYLFIYIPTHIDWQSTYSTRCGTCSLNKKRPYDGSMCQSASEIFTWQRFLIRPSKLFDTRRHVLPHIFCASIRGEICGWILRLFFSEFFYFYFCKWG